MPDERLDKLSEMSKTQKIVPAVVEFVDIAGLVKGASEGEGLGNKFLANIREVDAILQVVRVFKNDTIIHVHNEINPAEDIGVIETELALADFETVNKRIDRLSRDAKRGDKESIAKLAVAEKIKVALESGKLANEAELDMKDEMTKVAVAELSLLTIKPFLYVYNVSDLDEKLAPELESKLHVKIDIKIEEELEQMTKEEIKELGLKTGLDELIKKSYELLGLITFLTTGEKETRAWTIKKGSTAPEAGTAIHNDFKNKFICADVIAWDELIEYGSMSKAKEAGKVKQVGKDYIMQDGEVVEFKIGG
ncbi:MAG: GTP-binding protein YchF [Candidatus Moranbacteria bacterium GW2011_GWF2_35_54]|nr:MAG: GTP-binding protein YchF [Candidatus Moranbacteria bacterium GW2011_GWF2_35_54]